MFIFLNTNIEIMFKTNQSGRLTVDEIEVEGVNFIKLIC